MPDRRICPWDRKLPPWAWPSRLLPTTTSSDLTILNEIKLKGSYREVRYDHAGPAHLSMGQEAAAVGMAFALTPDDHIFRSDHLERDQGEGQLPGGQIRPCRTGASVHGTGSCRRGHGLRAYSRRPHLQI